MSVYIDLTEFCRNPVLSGIQRVIAQLCRHWPGDALQPVVFVPGDGLVLLDPELIGVIGGHFDQDANHSESSAQVRSIAARTRTPLRLGQHDVVLVPELFYDPPRVGFYEQLDALALRQYRFIVYDLIPLVVPEFFPGMQVDVICGYFRMIRRIPRRAFISQATRKVFYRRLLRSDESGGIVLRLGSDGLGLKPTAPTQRPTLKFTVVGRVEPSKNPGLILDAFEPLLRSNPALKLVFIGRVGHLPTDLKEKFSGMAADPHSGIEHHSQPSDSLIRDHLVTSRASLFLSAAEGFGLPPVESLWLGTPVIASPEIPSLELIGSAGVRIVDRMDAAGVRAAVLEFSDTAFAEAKAEQARALRLPTWKDFAQQTAEWCNPDSTDDSLPEEALAQ
jgi:glycosyltransferase involved in cell wall biosynthesis